MISINTRTTGYVKMTFTCIRKGPFFKYNIFSYAILKLKIDSKFKYRPKHKDSLFQ